MPAYQFYDLSPGAEEASPVQMTLYADEAAMRRAISERFPAGCDVWQGARFVGQFRAPASRTDPPPSEPKT